MKQLQLDFMKADIMTGHSHQLTNYNTIQNFLFAGKATATIVSKTTGDRFTFKVKNPNKNEEFKNDVWFVQVLNGPNNEWNGNWMYIGFCNVHGDFVAGKKGRPDATSFKAFNFLTKAVMAKSEKALAKLEFWHEGSCGSCGRKLTVPESIEIGLGPVCREK